MFFEGLLLFKMKILTIFVALKNNLFMEDKRNFITKRELDALYDETLWLMSEKFFGDKKNVWNDVLPAAAEILSSEDFDNNAWLLTKQWDSEVYNSLPKKSGEDMSERELRKYAKEKQPIIEVFKRSIKLYVLLCFFCHKESNTWDIILKSDPLNNAKDRIFDYIEEMSDKCENLLADRSIKKDVNRCLDFLENKSIERNFPYYDRSRLSKINIEYLVEKKNVSTKSNNKCCELQNLDSVANSTLVTEKDRRIKELEAILAERDGKIKELTEKLEDMEVAWDNAEENEKETPKSVQIFFIKQLLDIIFRKDTDFAKRDLVVLSSLLFNYSSPKSVYTHRVPSKNDYAFETKNEKEKIFDIAAALIHGMEVTDASLKNRVREICGKIPEDEDYVKLVSRLLPTK